MNKQTVLVNLSLFGMALAMAAFLWALIGASVAQPGKPGAYDFLLWPSVAIAALSWATLYCAKRIGPPENK